MTETDVRAVLLLRAFERTPAAGWTVGDAEWAGTQAHHLLGEQAAPMAGLARRARLGLARLAERDNRLAPWLAGAAPPAGSAAAHGRLGGLLLLLLAAALGLAGESLGTARVINLLAPPLLALLAWNLVVYAVLLGRALWAGAGTHRPHRARLARPHEPARGAVAVATADADADANAVAVADANADADAGAGAAAHAFTAVPAGAAGHGTVAGLAHPLTRALLRQWAAARAGWGHPPRRPTAPGALPGDAARQALAQFGRDWLAASLPLQTTRLTAWLHGAAAVLALGAVASLYARGLVFDYRAGWDSTFLDAHAVRQVLAAVLGPAAALSGLALPDVATLAGLRLATGGSEGAARWIHLWAITLLLAIVLPRAGLAAWAGWRARRLAADLPLPAGHDDLQRLLRSASGQALPVTVLPYSYALDAQRQGALVALLDSHLGPGVLAQVQPSLPLGAEDDLPRWLAGVPLHPHDPHDLHDPPHPHDSHGAGNTGGPVVALFALTATPERETHGAFVQALAAQLPNPAALQVMVDESGFKARFGAAGRVGAGFDQRLAQRRTAWRDVLQPLGVLPLFIDLCAAPGTGSDLPAGQPAGQHANVRPATPPR